MGEQQYRMKADGTLVPYSLGMKVLVTSAVVGVLALILAIMVAAGRSEKDPPNPCAGQDAETGMSEECEDFIEWTEDNPNRQILTLPGHRVSALVPGLTPRS